MTVSERISLVKVRLLVSHEHAPYVETQPRHHSQEVVERTEDGITISLKVQLNYELEREILGFGPGMIVLAPEWLSKIMHNKFRHGAARYDSLATIPPTLKQHGQSSTGSPENCEAPEFVLDKSTAKTRAGIVFGAAR